MFNTVIDATLLTQECEGVQRGSFRCPDLVSMAYFLLVDVRMEAGLNLPFVGLRD